MTMPAAPPPQTAQADVLAHRLEALHGDVGDIKAALRDLATAVTRLAVVEERQQQAAAAQERGFRALERVEARLTALEHQMPDGLDQRLVHLEQQAPQSTRAAAWVDRAVWACAAAGVMYVAKSAGLMH